MAGSDKHATSRLAMLASEVDRRFEAIQRRCESCMQCRSGCSDCCRARLSITRVEQAYLRRGLACMPASIRKEMAHRARDETREMCPALDPQGRCEIYAFRPLICRSYGVPLRHRREVELVNPPILDVCDKNFKGTQLRTLPAEDVLDQTGLDAAVSQMDTEYCEQNGLPVGDRVPIARILASADPDTRHSAAEGPRPRRDDAFVDSVAADGAARSR